MTTNIKWDTEIQFRIKTDTSSTTNETETEIRIITETETHAETEIRSNINHEVSFRTYSGRCECLPYILAIKSIRE